MSRKIYQVNLGGKKIIIQAKFDEKGYEAIFEHEGILCFASVVDLGRTMLSIFNEGKENTECMIFLIDEKTHEADFGTELYVNRTDTLDLLTFFKTCIEDFLEEYHAS